jgi:hypothetical protein
MYLLCPKRNHDEIDFGRVRINDDTLQDSVHVLYSHSLPGVDTRMPSCTQLIARLFVRLSTPARKTPKFAKVFSNNLHTWLYVLTTIYKVSNRSGLAADDNRSGYRSPVGPLYFSAKYSYRYSLITPLSSPYGELLGDCPRITVPMGT